MLVIAGRTLQGNGPVGSEFVQQRVRDQYMTTLSRIQRLLEERFGLIGEELQPDRPLSTLGVDSLAVTEFMFVLEGEFNIRLPYEPAAITTLQDMVVVIDRLILEQHRKPG